MNKRLIDVKCPYCHHTYTLMRDTYLLAGDKTEGERLLNRSYFMRQCSKCRSLFEISYPLIYKDPKKHFCLILSKTMPENFSFSGKSVRCDSPDQFYDAFIALDADLDLQRVLARKSQIRKHKGDGFTLESYDPVHHILWFKSDENYAGIGY